MIRRILAVCLVALVAGCGSGTVDADTRDLLRNDMTAVATAAASKDYASAKSALAKLLDDTEAAYRAGKISSSRRSEIVDAAAKVKADLDAATTPQITLPFSVPGIDIGGGNDGNGNGKGKGKGKDK
ncbi:hypothetical protein [Smaragdicoccus niigatensis]|uniref:hypothetical protein n=1 Tax=Smaragdicoccus niigatensis TaxID=359359 RepID=UPI000371207E|nr:hypothetical protein [Smaragdicoccus niigatensis]